MKKKISANAYRPSDAMNAVGQECRKQGIKYSGMTARLSTNQRDDDHVAIFVIKTSDGTVIPAKDRRTYEVIFDVKIDTCPECGGPADTGAGHDCEAS